MAVTELKNTIKTHMELTGLRARRAYRIPYMIILILTVTQLAICIWQVLGVPLSAELNRTMNGASF